MIFVVYIDGELTLRKNSQDDDTYGPYGSRGNESDGDDGFSGMQQNEADITSNVDILHRRGRDYEIGSASTVRPFISAPQYHLTPTEEEETERRQSARGQQLERMKYRRNARLSRQSAGVSKADTVPGFRGEASVEELMSYIDTPAFVTAVDCKTARKAKKKKKKVSVAGNSEDCSAQKLANSCEVFVGSSGVSSDEPSVRVGDSCCIELRKKSGFDSLSDTAATTSCVPDSHVCIESGERDKNIFADSEVNSQNAASCTDTSHLDVEIAEGLPEVGYTTMSNTVLEVESIPGLESVAFTLEGDETLLGAVVEMGEILSEVTNERNQTAADVDEASVESGETMKITDSICSLTTESSCDSVAAALPAVINKQQELDNMLPRLTVSDSVTSNTVSVEELFVTVQKKKRTKNTAVTAEDPLPRFGHRLNNTKGVEDANYCVKRSWVKSSDAASIVPSVCVSRSSVVCCKPLCTVSQRSSASVGQYTQASHHDTVLSSAVSGKCLDRLSLSAEAESNSINKEQSSGSKSVVTDSVCLSSSDRNTTSIVHKIKENEKSELMSDTVMPVSSTSPVHGIITTHWQAYSQKKLVCDSDNRVESSDMPLEMREMTSYATIVVEKPCVDVTACDKLNECSLKTDMQTDSMAGNMEVSFETGTVQPADVQSGEGKTESLQPSVQIVSASDVFLDTRYIAGMTPPRSDISFGFDPTGSPEPSDASNRQRDSSPAATFTSDVAASCHCPVVAPMPPPVAGCAPLLYFYPAMPVTILPPVATFPTGRCTPVGVVPPMPAIADASDISVALPMWQPANDKVVAVPSVPLPLDEQNAAVNSETVVYDVTTPSASNKATNKFVLYAAQRYLYSGMLSLCHLCRLFACFVILIC